MNQIAQILICGDFLTPIGANQQDRLIHRIPCQVMQKLQRRMIGPMNIVNG